MKKNIIINLEKVNQPQVYERREDSETEIFQYEALSLIESRLNFFIENIDSIDKDVGNDIHKVRRHDTIFIDGDRGIGKTAFLLNIEKHISKNTSKELFFFEPIDPTLLHDSEDFLGVVLGSIISGVEESNQLDCLDNQLKQNYFIALEKVSESLSSVNALKNENPKGIDEIASNASSIALENHVHRFLKATKNILGKKTLVLLIDDVDMAFYRGFDVLETIRKFLASPYLIPIVSGDGELYKRLIKNKFVQAYSNNVYKFEIKQQSSSLCEQFEAKHENSQQEECEQLKIHNEKINHMVSQYFNKVMPNDSRIALKSIFKIIKEHRVAVRVSDNKYIAYTDLKDLEIQSVNNKIYRKNYTERVLIDNTRSFVQYLAKKRELYKKLSHDWFGSKTEALEKEYKEYTPLIKVENQFSFIKKHLELTADFYRLSSNFKNKRLSVMLFNDIQAFKDEDISPYKVFQGELFADDMNREKYCHIEDEKLQEKLYLFKGSEKNGLAHYFDISIGWDYLLLRLFTHDDYYGTASSTKFHFYTGKFIEFMFFTMSIHEYIKVPSFEINDDNWDMFRNENRTQIEDVYQYINNICAAKPFAFSFPDHDYREEERVEGKSYNAKFKDDEKGSVLREIIEWNQKFNQSKDISFNTIQVYRILEKFFINLNIAKGHSYGKNGNKVLNIDTVIENDEHPLRFIHRVYMILLNAIGYFEVEGIPSNTNIGVTENKFSMHSYNTAQAYVQNIYPLENVKSSIQALIRHPLLINCLLMIESISNGLEKDNVYLKFIRYEKKQSKNIDKENRDKANILRGISKKYSDYYYKIIKRRDKINDKNVMQLFHTLKEDTDSQLLIEHYKKLLRRKGSPTIIIEEYRKTLGIKID